MNTNPAEALARRVRISYARDLGPVGAFLPDRVPLDVLPAPFEPYVACCAELPDRYPADRGGVRAWLDRRFRTTEPSVPAALRKLNPSELDSVMTVLSILGHVYRWDTVPPAPTRFTERHIRLPTGLDLPWRQAAALLGQPRVGTTWSLHLTNWRMTDRPGGAVYTPGELAPHNLRLAHRWLPAPLDGDLERFSLAFVLIEAAGATASRALVCAITAAAHCDRDLTLAALDDLRSGVKAIAKSFTGTVRTRHIDPSTWLRLIQPTFVWGAETDGKLMEGPSGLQLTTVQCLDAALGVRGDGAIAHAARRSRAYLPLRHRRFLTTVEQAGHVIPDFVRSSRDDELAAHYAACLKWLHTFRLAHCTRAADYLRAGLDNTHHTGLSTGMGITWQTGQDAVDTFHRLMAERMTETRHPMPTPTDTTG